MRQSETSSTYNRFFLAELTRLGPNQAPTAWSLDDARAYCRMWARKQYENFHVVSFLIPRQFRQDFFNIYAYCRWADNLADEVAEPDESRALLDWWEAQLRLCYSGSPAHPVLLALQNTIQSRQLDIRPFLDLLTAFRQDQLVHRYRDDQELLNYCRFSANPVGRILLSLADSDTHDNLHLSDQICTGLQLANFCQDISRDAERGRIYVPKQRWDAHSVDESSLLARTVSPAARAMLAEWVESVRGYLKRGWPLVDQVPGWLACDVDLFVRGGLGILQCIERSEFDVWTRRPTVSKPHKFQLLLRALAGRVLPRVFLRPARVGSSPEDRS